MKKKDIEKILKDFVKKAEESDSWYSLSGETLFNAVKNKSFLDTKENPEVMMTIESYKKFKKKFHEFLEDRTINSSYPSIRPIFFLDEGKRKEFNLRINIIVPTIIRKLRKFTKARTRMGFYYSRIYSNNIEKTKKDKFNYFMAFPFKFLAKPKSHVTFYNKLFSKKNEGYFEITEPYNIRNRHWIPQLTFKVEKIKISEIEFAVPYEYKTILTNWFPDEYKK